MKKNKKPSFYPYFLPSTGENDIVSLWSVCFSKVKGQKFARFSKCKTMEEAKSKLAWYVTTSKSLKKTAIPVVISKNATPIRYEKLSLEELCRIYLAARKEWENNVSRANRYLLKERFKNIEGFILNLINGKEFHFDGYVFMTGYTKLRDRRFIALYTEESFNHMKRSYPYFSTNNRQEETEDLGLETDNL